MSQEWYGVVIGAGIVFVQAVVIYALAKLLSVFTNRILPEKEEKGKK